MARTLITSLLLWLSIAALAQDAEIAQETAVTQGTTLAQETSVAQKTAITQATTLAQETSVAQETAITQATTLAQETSVAQETAITQATTLAQETSVAQESTLKLVFTGDIMGHDTQIASALVTGDSGYDYKPCFIYLEPYLNQADLVIGNLEVTLAGPPYKGYPQFSSPDELADALKWAGFDILVTANNHALDRRLKGLERTLEQLDQRGILHAGTYADPESRKLHYPLVFEKNGIRIALLNYTYGTNGLKVPSPAIVNRIDTALIRQDLAKAATAEPDFTIVTMHWGNEYQSTESQQQRELAAFTFMHGADAIIGSHPHVVQPIKGEGKGNLVAYSMGNLISNQRDRYRNGGIAFELELVKRADGKVADSDNADANGADGKGSDANSTEGDSTEGATRTEVLGHRYLPLWVWKPETKKGASFILVPANLDSASVAKLEMSAEDRNKMNQFLKDTRTNLDKSPEVLPEWMEKPWLIP